MEIWMALYLLSELATLNFAHILTAAVYIVWCGFEAWK